MWESATMGDVNPEDRQIVERLAKLQQMYNQVCLDPDVGIVDFETRSDSTIRLVACVHCCPRN